MKFSADWIENATNVASEERATVANFRLCLSGQNVTMNLREDVSSDHIVISLYPLAEGLAHDWWHLFGSREREVSLTKYRTGYAMPDIRLRYDGMAVEVIAHQKVYQNPALRFWAGPSEILTRQEAESSLSEFIELVLNRLHTSGQQNTSAALRWTRIQASRSDPQETEFCEAAGALGVDPYEISDRDAALIEKSASLFQKESLAEFLSGAKDYRTDLLLKWIAAAEKRPKQKACLTELVSTARKAVELAPERERDRSWALGYRRARSFRKVLNLQQTERIRSDKALAKKLGASSSFEAAKGVDGIRALRSHPREDEVAIHMRDHGSSPQAPITQLFSFTRAVGDVACFPSPTRSPVNELRSAYRQAAGRAFAAEFLAPIEEVLSMHADGHDSMTIANEFSVSTTVIELQIENADRIRAACA